MWMVVRSTRDARNQLEGAHAVAALFPQLAEQRHGRLHVGHGDERRGARAHLRKQLQARGGDHAERAFGAEEQRLDVVPRVVLAKRVERGQHAPIGEHDFEPEHLIAHHAVANDIGAAGVGGEVAADLAAAFGAETQRKEPVRFIRRALHVRENAAGFGDHRPVERIDPANAVEPPQRQHDLRRPTHPA